MLGAVEVDIMQFSAFTCMYSKYCVFCVLHAVIEPQFSSVAHTIIHLLPSCRYNKVILVQSDKSIRHSAAVTPKVSCMSDGNSFTDFNLSM